MAVRCITLDLDNTLWDVESVMLRAEKQTLLWAEQELPQLVPLLSQRPQMLEIMKELVADKPTLGINLGQLRLQTYKRALEKTGSPPEKSAGQAERIFEVHKHWRNQVSLYEGVEQGLESLAAQMKVGSITNGNADLNRIGLGKYFDFMLSPANTGMAKPDPGIYAVAAKNADLPAAEIVHMGDSAAIDVDGAREAGLQAIWFNKHKEAWPLLSPPPLQISSWSELPQALQHLG